MDLKNNHQMKTTVQKLNTCSSLQCSLIKFFLLQSVYMQFISKQSFLQSSNESQNLYAIFTGKIFQFLVQTLLKTIPSAQIPEVGYPTSRQKVSCKSFLFYLEISAMSPVQVRNNVESCSYSKEKFKLVKWSLLVTLETQTPYFEKSFKVEEDCECHLQGQICDNGMTINWHVEVH